jgi:hypothetical protein
VLTLCVLAGGAIVAYRNDYLFQLAKSFGQESSYLALERRHFGGAPDGTPRDVRKLVDGTVPAIQTVVLGSDTSRLSGETLGGSPAATDGSLAASAAATPGTTEAGNLPKPDARGGGEGETNAASERLAIEKPSSSGVTEAQSKPADAPRANAGARATAPSEPARRTFVAKASEDTDTPSRGVRERAQKRVPEPRPEPMPAAGTDDFLHMSMRQATKKKSGSGAPSSDAPPKKKSSRADYDPLNGDL